jgi:KDO2-lipid IV(A) lauroyltransferase
MAKVSSTRKLAIRRFLAAVKGPFDAVVGITAIGILRLIRRFDPQRTAALIGRSARLVGPWTSAHRHGRENLAQAFPDKTQEERDAILMGVWDNLGRTAAEYAHLDRLWDFDWQNPNQGRIRTASVERFNAMRDDGKPGLIFAAHLANWELPALLSAMYNFHGAVVYREPNNKRVAQEVRRIRGKLMGELIPTGIEGTFTVRRVLDDGGHVGMLVDQHHGHGVPVTFFGRECLAHGMIAKLARHYDCPIRGVRVVRRPDNSFDIDLTDELVLPRDAKGQIDEAATTQLITSIIEGWVREHPEQWLWLHRRWRKPGEMSANARRRAGRSAPD